MLIEFINYSRRGFDDDHEEPPWSSLRLGLALPIDKNGGLV